MRSMSQIRPAVPQSIRPLSRSLMACLESLHGAFAALDTTTRRFADAIPKVPALAFADAIPKVPALAFADAIPKVPALAFADAIPKVPALAFADAIPKVPALAFADAIPKVPALAFADAIPKVPALAFADAMHRLAEATALNLSLDYPKVPEFWTTQLVNPAFQGLHTSQPHRILDPAKQASNDPTVLTDLHASRIAVPVILLVSLLTLLLLLDTVLVLRDKGPVAVRYVFEDSLFLLRLLGTIPEFDPAISGLLLLTTIVCLVKPH